MAGWPHWLNGHVAVGVLSLFSHVRLCDPINCSTPGFPDFHCLPKLAQTNVHWVNDAIQPSHPLPPPSPPAPQSLPASGSFPMSQLFASGGQSTAASVSVKNQNSKQHYQALSVNYRFPWLSWEAWGTAREDQQGLGSPRDLLLGQFSHLWNEMTTLQGCHGFMFVKGTQSTDSLTS